MVSKYFAILFSFIVVFALSGCSATQEVSAYTSAEIEFDQQAKTHLNDVMTHIHNFDTMSKDAKPPYNDPVLLSNLQYELDRAAQDAQAITDLNCPSPRFDQLCDDFARMRDVIVLLRDDMAQYYASGLGASERQRVISDMSALNTSAKKIADDYAQLETQYGKIK